IAVITGSAMAADWPTLALYWYAKPGPTAVDPIFNRPLTFYFFTLPAWHLITGWLLTLAVVIGGVAVLFAAITGGTRSLGGRRESEASAWRGVSIAFAVVLLMMAARTYIGRFDRLFEDHTIFAGVTYTDAHVSIGGLLLVAVALVLGAAIALVNAVAAPRAAWLALAVAPAAVVYAIVGLIGWYVTSFVVKPN